LFAVEAHSFYLGRSRTYNAKKPIGTFTVGGEVNTFLDRSIHFFQFFNSQAMGYFQLVSALLAGVLFSFAMGVLFS